MADDMVAVTRGKESSIASEFFDGLVSMPATMGYLAYDFLDTDRKYEKDNDKIRLMRLIKNGLVNRETIYKVLSIIISFYLSKLSDEQKTNTYLNVVAKQIGKVASNSIVLGSMNSALVAKFARRILFSMAFSTVLTIGAEQSKAVYVSRRLMTKNPTLYWTLRSSGDLDLLYFLVEGYTKPFEEAALLKGRDEAAFNELINLYLIKLAE